MDGFWELARENGLLALCLAELGVLVWTIRAFMKRGEQRDAAHQLYNRNVVQALDDARMAIEQQARVAEQHERSMKDHHTVLERLSSGLSTLPDRIATACRWRP